MKIAVTGHRRLDHDLNKIIEKFSKALETLKPELVITGMAIGFDQAVALACLNTGTPFEAAIPFLVKELEDNTRR